MARQNPDPYLVLGVSPTATQAEITHAYRTRLRAHHPDTRHPPPPKPPTTTSGKSWPLTTCCAIPPAAPTTTAPPSTPPHHYRTTHAGRHLVEHPGVDRPTAPSRSPITYRTTNTRTPDVSSPPLRAGPVRRHR